VPAKKQSDQSLKLKISLKIPTKVTIIADRRDLTKMKHVNKATHRCGGRGSFKCVEGGGHSLKQQRRVTAFPPLDYA